MNNPELSKYHKTLEEGGGSPRELTPQEQTIFWANQVLEKHNSLPKRNRNSAERRARKNLASQTATLLLANPQDIDTAGNVWKSYEIEEEKQSEDEQKTKSFYDLVKQEVSRDIRKQWMTTTTEQFGQLVKVYEGSVFMQDVLAEYINRPQPVNQSLTVQEASELLHVDSNTLRRWDQEGKFKPAVRLGKRRDRRYRLDDVMNLINKS